MIEKTLLCCIEGIPSGLFKGRRARHLRRPPFLGAPLKCYTNKFSLFLVKNLLSTHIMCYKADRKFKVPPTETAMCRYFAYKGATNRNYNV